MLLSAEEGIRLQKASPADPMAASDGSVREETRKGVVGPRVFFLLGPLDTFQEGCYDDHALREAGGTADPTEAPIRRRGFHADPEWEGRG